MAEAHLPEDMKNARLERTAPQDSVSPTGGQEPDRDGDAQSAAAPSGTGQEPGAVSAGRGEGRRSTWTTSSRHRTRSGNGAAQELLPPPLIDKAGNIRLDKLNQPEDIDQVIRDLGARNDNYLRERRGVVSEAEAVALAEAKGEDPAWIDRKKIGEAYSEEELRVLQKLLIELSKAVKAAMEKAAGGDEKSLIALAEAIARQEMIQAKSSGARQNGAAPGALCAWCRRDRKDVEDIDAMLKANTGRDLFQLQRMAQYGSKLYTPSQVAKFTADPRGTASRTRSSGTTSMH